MLHFNHWFCVSIFLYIDFKFYADGAILSREFVAFI